METHLNDHHPEIDLRDPNNRLAETHFTMKLHKRYKTPMDRQLGEAICIQRAGGMDSANVMNSRDEYSRCILPEIEIRAPWTKTAAKRPRETENRPENSQKSCKRPKFEIHTPHTPHTENTHTTEDPTQPTEAITTTPESSDRPDRMTKNENEKKKKKETEKRDKEKGKKQKERKKSQKQNQK